jgi:hypothetical protein
VSEWLLFNANSAIFQLCHGESKLIFNGKMMRSTLVQTAWMVYHVMVIFSVLDRSAIDRGFETRSGQTKDYKIGICCFSGIHFNSEWVIVV